MSDVNLATKSDLASLFQELEDAAKHAKKENKENKIKTESQVKELDSFLTSVQEVVKVIDESPKEEIKVKKPKVVEIADIVVEEPVIKPPVVETKSLSKEDENKLGAFAGLMSSFGAILDAPPEVKDTDALKLQIEDIYPKVVTQEEENSKLEALQNLFSNLVEEPRIPRKKGQPAGSDKHSDLYTDENPVGTIKGLGFKDVKTARASVKKIEGSDRTHAHKIQAAVAMEQRAKEMGKTAEAAIYRSYIEKMKKKTKEMQKEEFVLPELEPVNIIEVAKDTPVDITKALTEVKQRALPTKEETVEATQELITNVIDNLDDMKSKTEVKEQLSEIDTIRQEFDNFRSLVSQQIASNKMSGAGSGEVRLEFLDDVDRDTAKVNNKYLKYNSTTGKFVGSDPNLELDTAVPYSATAQELSVTVASKDSSHPYYGTGSSNGYKIDGVFSPYLQMIPLNTYKFDQSDSSNSGHPLRFYYEADKSTAYTTGVTTSGTPGSSGAYTQIIPTDSTPSVLFYQCSSHAHMGWGVFLNTRNFTGLTSDDLTEGSSNKFASAETVQDIVGAMVSSNTETDINVTYDDSDGTLDFVVSGISGNAATATALATARTIHGVSFDGTANIDLTEVIEDTVGAMVSGNTETGITVTYQDGDGTYDFALAAAQTTITSLLATDIKIGEDDETKIDFETADEIHFYAANAHQVKIVDGAIVPATDNDIDLGTSGAEFKDAYFDGTVTSDAFAGPLTGNADTATALATARNIGGISFDGTSDINLAGVNTTGNQDTTGNAATATSATAADTVKTVVDGTDANFFLTFVSDNNSSATAEAIKTDAGLQYNPSTDTLSVTNITATIDGVSAQINVADESSDTTCFPVFVTSASGNLAAKSGTNLTFNSSTGALTATSFVDGDGNALVSATAAADEATALGIALG